MRNKNDFKTAPLLSVEDCTQLVNLMPREQYRVFVEMWDIIATEIQEFKDYALSNALPYYYNDEGEFLGNDNTLKELAENIAQSALERYKEASQAEERKKALSEQNRANIQKRWQKEKSEKPTTK